MRDNDEPWVELELDRAVAIDCGDDIVCKLKIVDVRISIRRKSNPSQPPNRKYNEQKNAPELPVGRFLKSKSLGGNLVILVVLRIQSHSLMETLNDSTIKWFYRSSTHWNTRVIDITF